MANSILPILIGYFAIGKQLKSKHSIRIKKINRHSYPPIRDIQIQINYEARATLRIQIAVCQTTSSTQTFETISKTFNLLARGHAHSGTSISLGLFT